MARTLIAGCGDVGTALGRRLLEAGQEVVALRRRADRLPAWLPAVSADLGAPRTLAAVLEGPFDRVVYTAAATGFSDDAYRAAYVDGVCNLLSLLVERGDPVARVVFVSSTGVYGQEDGDWVDESSPAEPRGFSGRRLLQGEAVVAESPFEGVSVRFGGIYGPGRTRLLDRVRSGAGCQAAPPRYTNRIHRDDCAGALEHLLRLESPAAVYIGVDREPAPECEVMDWLAERLGVPPPPRDRAPASEGRRAGSKRCSSRRLAGSGYRFLYPSYREGYAAVLASQGAPG